MKSQATRLDVIEAQRQRVQTRRELVALIPCALAACYLIAAAFVEFFTA